MYLNWPNERLSFVKAGNLIPGIILEESRNRIIDGLCKDCNRIKAEWIVHLLAALIG
jgi:hypothetical protein